jgi:enoyl-CoA hydratase/carnithine racemase
MSDAKFQVVSAHQRDALAQALADESTRVIVLLDVSKAEGDVTTLIESSGKPVIAAVDGTIAGAGFRCVCACAFAVASEGSTFALPVVMPERPLAVEAVSSFVGERKRQDPAFERLLAGNSISAQEALELGLVTQIAAGRDELLAVCGDLAREMSSLAPLALRFALDAVTRGLRLPLADALQIETELFARCFATDDVREGVRAFYEKRPPRFLGK